MLDGDGKVLPGYSRSDCEALKGDSVDQVVTWGGNKTLPAGKGPVRLCFVMQNASVYSFMAGDTLEVIVAQSCEGSTTRSKPFLA